MAYGTEPADVLLTPSYSNDRADNLALVIGQLGASRLKAETARFIELASSAIGITTAIAAGTNSISYAGQEIGAVVHWKS